MMLQRLELLRKFILIKEELAYQNDIDYIIIDTSPVARYWSINSLAIADLILLSLKMDSIDIEGTKKMANEIYSAFTKLGTKSLLLFKFGECWILSSTKLNSRNFPCSRSQLRKCNV